MAPCPPSLGSLDMSGIILTTGTFWLRTTLLYNYTMNTHYTTSTLSGFQHILSLFSLLPPPPPPHTHTSGSSHRTFPYYLETWVYTHDYGKYISNCICIFNVLFFFLFADPPAWPPREAFSDGPSPSCLENFWIGGEENIWRNVPFRGAVWESWFQSHRESFNYSPLNAFRLFWAASPMCCTNDLCGTRRRVEWTHASMSVGGHALPPHPLILKWLHSPPPPTHTHTTTITTPPPLPQSSSVAQSAALLVGMKSENPRSVLLSSVYTVLWPYLFLLIICR